MTDKQTGAEQTSLGHAAPIFRVRDLAASISYYTKVLGFAVDWTDPGGVASVSRDRCCIFLCQGDQGAPCAWTWIGVNDVDVLHAELRDRGARIRHPPTNYYWACEMQVEDLDSNVLRIGSESNTDQPFGDWLDMHGNRWKQSEDGQWTHVPDQDPTA